MNETSEPGRQELAASDRVLAAGLTGLMGAFAGAAFAWMADAGPGTMIAAGAVGYAGVFGPGWCLAARPRLVRRGYGYYSVCHWHVVRGVRLGGRVGFDVSQTGAHDSDRQAG